MTAIGRSWAAVAALLGAILLGQSLHAATWIGPLPGNGTAGGVWTDDANWNPAGSPNAIGAAAEFIGGILPTNRVFTLGGDVTVGSLTLDNTATRTNTIGVLNQTTPRLTFEADAEGPATLDVTGTSAIGGTATPHTFLATVALNDDLVIDVDPTTSASAAGTVTFRGGLTGTGGVTKNGLGTLTFADTAKTFQGPLIVNAGRLRFNGPAYLFNVSSVTVNAGGQIAVENVGNVTFGDLTAPPTVTLNGFGLGAESPTGYFPGSLRTGSGLTQTMSNPIVLASDASIDVVGAGTGAAGELTLSGVISGPGKLYVNQMPGDPVRTGVLNLIAANTYAGGTHIEQGILTVKSGGSLGTGDVYVDGMSLGPVFGQLSAGRLHVDAGAANVIADTAVVTLTGDLGGDEIIGGRARLAAGVNEVIGGLILGGVRQRAGAYGSTASAAANKSDAYFDPIGGLGIFTVMYGADFNADGQVDDLDYSIWRGGFGAASGATKAVGDADGDGDVDGLDFLVWQQEFGAPNVLTSTPLARSVPEPSGAALVGCALFAMRRRR